jgi:tetratricopeptide (TPR) repeat protein
MRRLAILLLLVASLMRAQACQENRYQGINQRVCEALNTSDSFLRRQEPAPALAILKELPVDSSIAPDLAAAVRSERIRAQEASAAETAKQATLLATLAAGFETKFTALVEWLLLLGGAAVVLWGLSALYRLRAPQDAMLISIADHTADKITDTANLLVSQESAHLLNPLDSLSADELTQHSLPGNGGSVFVNLQPVWATSYFETALASGSAVDLGVFKITPQALIQAFRTALRPVYRDTLDGVLSAVGQTTYLVVRRLDAKGRLIPGKTWFASSTGADARENVLREVMAKVVIDMSAEQSVTTEWQSLKLCQQAMDKSRDDKSVASTAVAQQLLQKALAQDPANWIARYNNALFLQLLGKNEASLDNWSFLMDMVSRRHVSSSLSSYLIKHPDFIYKIEYNRAITLARIFRWPENTMARKILANLSEVVDGDMRVLALSALANALSAQYKLMKASYTKSLAAKSEAGHEDDAASGFARAGSGGDKSSTKSVAEPIKVQLQLEEVTQGLIDALEDSKRLSRSIFFANAVARYARGAVRFELNHYKDALEDFNAASLLNPEFVDPQLSAARTLRAQKFTDWTLRVRSHLDAVLDLDDTNREAHFLLGSLLSDISVFRLEEAAIHYEKADPHSWAAYELGNLYLDAAFAGADPLKALQWLRKSVRLADAVDRRALGLAELILNFVEHSEETAKHGLDCYRMANEALVLLRKVQLKSGKSGQREKAQKLQKRFEELLTKIQPPPGFVLIDETAAKEPAPGTQDV